MGIILGTPGVDVLVGNPENDVISGFDGNDTLQGEGGGDRLVGGLGNDELQSGAGNDVLIGNKGSDAIFGGDGDDNSIWVNGDGSDFIDGGADNDVQNIFSRDGDIFALSANGADQVEFSRSNLIKFTLTIDNVETVRVVGNGGDDALTVGDLSATDTDKIVFIGGDGNDAQRFNMAASPGDEMTLSGDAGVATFARTNFNQVSVDMQQVECFVESGLDGDDILTLDNVEEGGIFSVNFAGGNGQDQVLTDPSTTVRVIADGGESVDQLNGGAANDVLIRGAGQDNLVGNDGRDRLLGQAGDDTLTDGAGRDTFVFTPGSNNDTITDFEIGQDIIRYSLATFVFDDLNISTSSGDLLIATPEGDSITLVGLEEETLTSADFLIVA
jgi:Ca2+-binding RTX toxin-like protein